jgi:Apea-like HEPN/ApeA N-terminal domain 1
MDNTPITLTNLIRPPSIPGMSSGTKRFGTSTVNVGMIIVGEHFEREEEVGFERLIVQYLHLDAWAGVFGFEIAFIDDPDTHPITMRHELPEPIAANVGDEYQVKLFFGSGFETSPRPFTHATITQVAELVISFSEKKPLQDLLDIAYRLQHLLSLGTRRSAFPVAMWGAMGPVGEVRRVGIYYRTLGRTGTLKERPVRHEMLFSLRDLPGGFGPAVEKWLARAEVLDPVYRLYLGTVYNPQMFLEQRFLSLVQALEAYHRRTTGALDLPEDEHEKRMEAILAAVPEEHSEWLEGKLRYSNEPNLRKRIKHIFDEHPQTVNSVVGSSSKDKKTFINKVIDTRNYRTHFDESLDGRAARDEELHRINDKLRHLIEMCLMAEIGFEDDEIKMAVTGVRTRVEGADLDRYVQAHRGGV